MRSDSFESFGDSCDLRKWASFAIYHGRSCFFTWDTRSGARHDGIGSEVVGKTLPDGGIHLHVMKSKILHSSGCCKITLYMQYSRIYIYIYTPIQWHIAYYLHSQLTTWVNLGRIGVRGFPLKCFLFLLSASYVSHA